MMAEDIQIFIGIVRSAFNVDRSSKFRQPWPDISHHIPNYPALK